MAVEGLVNIDPFFKSKFKFPWDFMGLTLPCAGTVHGYVASIMAQYCQDPDRSLLSQRPAMFELRRFAKDPAAATCQQIVAFVDRVEGSRDSVAAKVLEFLAGNQSFRQAFQAKIDDAYRRGVVSIPKECEPGGQKWRRHTSESW